MAHLPHCKWHVQWPWEGSQLSPTGCDWGLQEELKYTKYILYHLVMPMHGSLWLSVIALSLPTPEKTIINLSIWEKSVIHLSELHTWVHILDPAPYLFIMSFTNQGCKKASAAPLLDKSYWNILKPMAVGLANMLNTVHPGS
jgi:hypothetical protein